MAASNKNPPKEGVSGPSTSKKSKLTSERPGPNSEVPEPTSKRPGPKSKVANPTSKVAGPTSKVADPTSKAAGRTSKAAGPTSKVAVPTSKVADPTSKAADPTSKVADPTSKVASPTSKAAGPTSEVAVPTIKVADPTSKVADSTSKVASPTSKVADPTSKVAVPTNKVVANPTSKVADPTSKVASPTSQVPDPTSKVADPTSKVAGPTSKVLDPTSKVVDTTSKVADATSNVADPTSKVAGPTSKVPDSTSKVADPTSKVADLTNKVTDPTSNVAGPTSKVPDETSKVADPTSKVTDPTRNLAGPTSKVPDPTSTVAGATSNAFELPPIPETLPEEVLKARQEILQLALRSPYSSGFARVPTGAKLVSASLSKEKAGPTPVYPNSELKQYSDILVTIRVFKPVEFEKVGNDIGRHMDNMFYHDMVLTGRHKVGDIKKHFMCSECKPGREDTSNNGFLFINNALYVDFKERSARYADALRLWCAYQGIGDMPKYDMHDIRLDELHIKYGRPDSYIHDLSCEHIIMFLSARVVNPRDPSRVADYPHIAKMLMCRKPAFCYGCTARRAAWIVAGHAGLSFSMAVFCDFCRKQYLCDESGKQIGEFNIFPYGALPCC